MPVQNTPIDIIAYSPDGRVVLLAEAKSRHNTSDEWAAKLRRNMLAHGVLPPSEYFLIATPERMYGWRQAEFSANEALPHFTVNAREALERYFAKLDQGPKNVGPEAFELMILAWLTEIAESGEYQSRMNPSLRSLSDSGLISSLSRARIQMNPSR
jgi:hypothetical protein